jgi:hypothetical protein
MCRVRGLFAAIVLLATRGAYGQMPDAAWALPFGGPQPSLLSFADQGYGVATKAVGSGVFAVGAFQSAGSFGPFNLTAVGTSKNAYICSIDTHSNVRWAQSFKGVSSG